MKLYPDSKVYILCPGSVQTGGPELAHQFASTLISFGVQAYMFYYVLVGNHFNKEDPVHDVYKKYHVPYVFKIEDKPHNIVIVPETVTEPFCIFKKIRRVIWWMSIDNYLENTLLIINECLKAPLSKPMRNYFTFYNADKDIEHFVQSEYARLFLKLNGVPDSKIYIVEDYLNQTFLSRATQVDLSRKENLVVFNPKKGFEITSVLIKFAPDINWRPIQNMTPAQVQELLAQAKVYIDFGNHPGKDRIPREAAISGCVVIVGKRGAAANDVDINIPDEFKFDMQATPRNIIKKIHEVFENFPAAHEKQAAYRARILDDKNRFTNEVTKAFNINETNFLEVILPQGISDAGSELLQKFQGKSIMPNFIVDDVLAATKISDDMILREQNRNYLRVAKNLVEIITRDDAKFLYLEGRIKKFALLKPTDAELAELKDFYEADDADILIFNC